MRPPMDSQTLCALLRPAGDWSVAHSRDASHPLLDLYLAVLERGSQGFGIPSLNRPGQRILAACALNPAQHRGASGQPLPAHLAAGQFSFLKQIVNRIRRDSQQAAVMCTSRISGTLATGERSTSFLGFPVGLK
jgi:hypothetical protein